MVNKKIGFHSEYECMFTESIPSKRAIGGEVLAKKLGIEVEEYRRRLKSQLPAISFVPNCVPLLSMDIVRPEILLSENYLIEIPDGLMAQHDTLCNSGDILHKQRYDVYYLFLGKFDRHNLAINLSSLRCRLFSNAERSSMERLFNYKIGS